MEAKIIEADRWVTFFTWIGAKIRGESFSAVTIYPFVFVRKGRVTSRRVNHESIHIRQQGELWVIPFYILYFSYWAYHRIFSPKENAYRLIPFEREAYENDENLAYLYTRRPHSWLAYRK
jgi:hypothetical protein